MIINFKNSNSCNFRKIFYFFSQYCEIVNKRGTEYSQLTVTVGTSFVFDFLRVGLVENGWTVGINEKDLPIIPIIYAAI